MTHTPGPWSCGADYRVASSAGRLVADVAYPSLKRIVNHVALDRSEERAANLRLIAAAPDLLAVCEWLLECAEEWIRCGFIGDASLPAEVQIASDPDLERARVAIAKAKGEQP